MRRVKIERPITSEPPVFLGSLKPLTVTVPPREPHGIFSITGERLVPPGESITVRAMGSDPLRMEPAIPGLAVVWQYGSFAGVFEDGTAVDPARIRHDWQVDIWVETET